MAERTPDALTRRDFVQRLVGGTGLTTGRFGRIIGGAALSPFAFPRAAKAATLAPTADVMLRDSAFKQNFNGARLGVAFGVFPTGSTNTFAAVSLSDGTYFLRVRGRSAAGLGPPSNELSFTLGAAPPCSAPPAAPATLVSRSDQLRLALAWSASDSAVSYLLEAGSAPGAANLARINVGRGTAFNAIAPPGTYYFRVRATNACGQSAPSPEVQVVLSSMVPAPAAPGNLTVVVVGRTVRLSWTAPSTGTAPDDYLLEVGSAPGLSNLMISAVAGLEVVATDVPVGSYYVRVRARNGGGISAPSAEVVVVVA